MMKFYFYILAGLLSAAMLTACSSDEDSSDLASPNPPPLNPWLADSAAPMGHVNASQTTGQQHAGPTGPTETLSREDGSLTYTHLGPAHFGLAISSPYPDGGRVIWSNGGDRISKLDYDTLGVIAEYALLDYSICTAAPSETPPLDCPITEETADSDIALLDAASKEPGTGLSMILAGADMLDLYLGGGVAGVYYLLGNDNVLYVGGPDSIVAYADADPSDRNSSIAVKDEWPISEAVGEGVTGSFNSINMTFDGWLCATTDEGWIVMIKRDFSDYRVLQLDGAEVAPAWNEWVTRPVSEGGAGLRDGAASWVRNGPAIDEDGGIYIPSLQHMHKVIWDGDQLSKVEADGAWVVPYSNDGELSVTFDDIIDPETGKPYTFENVNKGSGSTASLMGFDNEDQFAVITDGDQVMNMVLFWRNQIPEGWQQLPNAPSPRIAGMLRADIGNDTAEAVQTEQSVVVGGYGAFVVNNAPAIEYPFPIPEEGYIALAGNHPDITPRGVQKFHWNPQTRALEEAWVNLEASSINCVPIVSTGSNVVYTQGATPEGDYKMNAMDWTTGESLFEYVLGSSRYNTHFSGYFLDQEGRLIHTTFHGIVRYERLPN